MSRTIIKKKQFLQKYQENFGRIGDTCIEVKISRHCYYNWLDTDPEFKADKELLDESFVNFVEKKVYAKINEADNYWMREYLRNRCPERWGRDGESKQQVSGEIKLVVERRTITKPFSIEQDPE